MTREQFSPDYFRVWSTFFRNSLVREMTFRGNFIVEGITRLFWFAAQVTLFDLIYRHVPQIQDWSREEYFGFMATTMLVNALVEAFFMPNCANFSELVRTGDLDFVLLKPIDTQFLISFQKVSFAKINQIGMALCLLAYAVSKSGATVTFGSAMMYMLYICVGVGFYYSMMVSLASTSIWLGRNQGLYDFWFYITEFSRYPQNVYRQSGGGEVIWFTFSFIVPILLAITVPARIILQKSMQPSAIVLVIAPVSTAVLLLASRAFFKLSLSRYRSASS